jgi:hypothetical protein
LAEKKIQRLVALSNRSLEGSLKGNTMLENDFLGVWWDARLPIDKGWGDINIFPIDWGLRKLMDT